MPAFSRKRIISTIVIAALGALASKIVGQAWDFFFAPFPLEVDVYTLSASGKATPATGATVELDIPAVEPGVEAKTTNGRGKVVWTEIEPHPFKKMSISVTLPGYRIVSAPSVPVRRRYGSIDTYLTPVAAVEAAPPTKPGPDMQKEYRSGPQPSGPGKDFGAWNNLCSNDSGIPANYEIREEHFVLVGDRQCNAWSECKQTAKTPRQVCYQFRMQGHDEWTGPFHGLIPSGNSGVALSEGVLSVTWGPK